MTRLRLFVGIALALAAGIAAPGANAQSSPRIDEGVVQSAAAGQLVIRALDGSDLAFRVPDTTRVFLNGLRTPLIAVRPGYVARVTHRGTGRALAVRAFGSVSPREQGVVASFSGRELLLTRDDGSQITIPVSRATRFRRGAAPVGPAAVRVGRRVTVRLAPNGVARAIVVR
jgi:hypothetical protein